MASLDDRIAALENALASGVKRVRAEDGSETEFNSMADIRYEVDRLKAEKVQLSGSELRMTRVRRVFK
mgnify:CR=1 FL=1